MFIIFRKFTIVCYERESRKYEFVEEKYNNWQLFVTREYKILNLLKR